MTKHAPPVPPDNKSPKGPGDDKTGNAGDITHDQGVNPDKKGQQANTKQNTHHQGYQQDR